MVLQSVALFEVDVGIGGSGSGGGSGGGAVGVVDVDRHRSQPGALGRVGVDGVGRRPRRAPSGPYAR